MILSDAGSTLIRQVIEEICNAGRLEVADDLFAGGYINHGGLIPDLIHGPEAIKISVALYRRAFPGITFTIENIQTHECMLTCDWVARQARPSQHAGGGSLASAAEFRGQIQCRLVDGQIAESWMNWNRAQTLHQLGIALLPEAAGLGRDSASSPARSRPAA